MNIPAKVQSRRDELHQIVSTCNLTKAHLDAEVAKTELRHEMALAELAGLARADEAYAEQSPEPAAELEPVARNSRAPRRDIRGMVLAEVRNSREVGATIAAVAALLAVAPARAKAAVDYLAATGKLWVGDGVVMHKDFVHKDFLKAPLDQAAE